MTHTELSGAFLEIAKVDDPDGSPTVTVLGFTTDDVEIAVDEDEASAEGHSDRRRIRRRTYNEASVTVSRFIEETVETWNETGFIDTTDQGSVQFNASLRTWDACLVRVYEEAEDASPTVVNRLDEVEWHMPDGVTYPSDMATTGMEGWIHGTIYLDADDIT